MAFFGEKYNWLIWEEICTLVLHLFFDEDSKFVNHVIIEEVGFY